MPTGIITSVASVGGLSITSTTTREAATQLSLEDDLPVGQAGTMTASDETNGTGTLVLGTNHGITNGALLMLFWDNGSAHSVTVGTVSGNSVPFTGAVGMGTDTLNTPANNTAIVATVQIAHDIDFDFDDVELFFARSTSRAGLVFSENDDTVLYATDLTANEPMQWASGTGITIPMTGDPVGKIKLACANSTAAGAFKLGAIINSE